MMKHDKANYCKLILTLGSWVTLFAAQAQVAVPLASSPTVIATPTIRIDGLVATPRTLTPTDLASLPRLTQSAPDKAGKKHEYSGFALSQVLALAGAPQGKDIHGPVLAYALLVSAADGYQAVFALPEIDPSFNTQIILLADQCDGQPLTAEQGLYQIIVPQEKRPARWVRQVTGLKIVAVK